MKYREKTIKELENIIAAFKVILEFSVPGSELCQLISSELKLAEEALELAKQEQEKQAREFAAAIADLGM